MNSEDTDSGVWFNVIRSGEGRDTEYDVKKFQTKVKNAAGKISFEDDRSPLPDSVVEGYDDLAYDLGSVYQIKTYEELAEILAANMESLIELCPDADLDAFERVVIAPQPTKTVATATATAKTTVAKPVGTKPVSVRLDDDEDDVVDNPRHPSNLKSSTVRMTSTVDDDFLAEADALLNS